MTERIHYGDTEVSALATSRDIQGHLGKRFIAPYGMQLLKMAPFRWWPVFGTHDVV